MPQRYLYTLHGLECHLEKCHKDIYTLYARKVESRQQGPLQKGETGRGIAYGRCIVWGWLGDWMYEKKHYIYQVTFVFVFGRKWNFIFVGIFVYSRKWKMLLGRPLYITKRSWSWYAKSWSWKNFKVWSYIGVGLGLEKSLDYITAYLHPQYDRTVTHAGSGMNATIRVPRLTGAGQFRTPKRSNFWDLNIGLCPEGKYTD